MRTLFWILAVGAAGAPGRAQSAAPGASPAEPAPPPAREPSRIAFNFSLAYTTDYYFRGIAQRTDSFNLQPAGSVSYALVRDGDLTLSALGGVWTNFSDDTSPGASGSFREHWYELDLYTGLTLQYERLTFSGVYTWYTSPSSDFTEYEDITLTLGFGDAGLWGDDDRFSLNPYVSLAIGTQGAAAGPDAGVWLGLGLTPTFVVGPTPLGKLTLSAPIGVGLGFDNYYQLPDGESSTFGFFQAGGVASFALPDVLGAAAPKLDIGVQYLLLDGVTQTYNAGDPNAVVFTLTLGWSF